MGFGERLLTHYIGSTPSKGLYSMIFGFAFDIVDNEVIITTLWVLFLGLRLAWELENPIGGSKDGLCIACH